MKINIPANKRLQILENSRVRKLCPEMRNSYAPDALNNQTIGLHWCGPLPPPDPSLGGNASQNEAPRGPTKVVVKICSDLSEQEASYSDETAQNDRHRVSSLRARITATRYGHTSYLMLIRSSDWQSQMSLIKPGKANNPCVLGATDFNSLTGEKAEHQDHRT